MKRSRLQSAFVWCIVLAGSSTQPPVTAADPFALPSTDDPYSYDGHISVSTQEVVELKPGDNRSRTVASTSLDFYSITVPARSSVIVTVPTHEMSVQVTAVNAANQKISMQAQQHLIESVVRPTYLVATTEPETYRIEVASHAAGSYSIRCTPAAASKLTDNAYSEAQVLQADYLLSRGLSQNVSAARQDLLERRIALYRAARDVEMTAVGLTDLAGHFAREGRFDDMLAAYNEAATLFHSVGRTVEEVNIVLATSADLSSRSSDFQAAIDQLNAAVELSAANNYTFGRVRALRQLGTTYQNMGDEETALDCYQRALDAIRTMAASPITIRQEAGLLTDIGNIYAAGQTDDQSFGAAVRIDIREAMNAFRRALALYRQLKSDRDRSGSVGEADTLVNIGNAYRRNGEYIEAEGSIVEAVNLYRQLRPAYRQGHTFAIKSLGGLYVSMGHLQRGLSLNDEAWSMASGDNAKTKVMLLGAMATDQRIARNGAEALRLHRELIALAESSGQLGAVARSLYESARIEREAGNFGNARNQIERALEIAESIRGRISALELRAAYFSYVRRFYDFYIDLMMQAHKSQPDKGFERRALDASEQARSRALLDLLSVSGIELAGKADSHLISQEKLLRRLVAQKSYEQDRMLTANHSTGAVKKVREELSDLVSKHAAIQDEIRRSDPRYAALTQVRASTSFEIQTLLDPGSVLLEYVLGAQSSYVWVVKRDEITSFELPPRDVIERQVRELHGLLTERNSLSKAENLIERSGRIAAADAAYQQAAAELSAILIGPISQHIKEKRLVIIPDGVLNYVPFTALPVTGHRQQAVLGLSHEIVMLPSASVLKLLRSEQRNPASKVLAIFADPVFVRSDSRASPSPDRARRAAAPKSDTRGTDSRINLYAGLENTGTAAFAGAPPRLQFSRREANAILAATPAPLRKGYLDFDANKGAVVEADLGQYRIIHFATHGLLDSRNPSLSGLVLSLVDRSGNQIDGFLRLQDIYNLKLNADLVVLSACSTALGKEVRGEGIVGLTRGFMYAGTSRVVASLWKVDDAATAHLMSVFYRKMLVEDMRPAAALRAAQLEMMKQPRWRSPYYWAPFVLQGEWR